MLEMTTSDMKKFHFISFRKKRKFDFYLLEEYNSSENNIEMYERFS